MTSHQFQKLGTCIDPSWMIRTSILAIFTINPSNAAWAQSTESSVYAEHRDDLSGDRLTFRTNAQGFKILGRTQPEEYCAPKGSTTFIKSTNADSVSLRFQDVPGQPVGAEIPDHLRDCPTDKRVNTHEQYTISRAQLGQYSVRRTGFTFGGLVVPFKVRLGSSREIVSSATVAPYIGWRTSYEYWGLSLTPTVSAGLGLVPINADGGGSPSTRAAFSTAFGLVLGSDKNQAFHAGLLLGKDFLSRADRQIDPSAKLPWWSFFVGYAL